MTELKRQKLVNKTNGASKFYTLVISEADGLFCVTGEYGRLGNEGRPTISNCGSYNSYVHAVTRAEQVFKDKSKKGYTLDSEVTAKPTTRKATSRFDLDDE